MKRDTVKEIEVESEERERGKQKDKEGKWGVKGS